MIIKVPGTVFYSLFWHYDYSLKNFFYSLGEKEKSFLLKGSSIFKHMVVAAAAKSHQSCPTLCDPIDCSSPGSPIPGILQARTLEWVAISFSDA